MTSFQVLDLSFEEDLSYESRNWVSRAAKPKKLGFEEPDEPHITV